MADNRMEKLNEIMEQNADTIAQFEEPAQVQAFMASKGVNLSDSEMAEFASAAEAYSKTGELSEDDLDNVSGGWIGGVLFVGGCYIAGRCYGKWARKKIDGMTGR